MRAPALISLALALLAFGFFVTAMAYPGLLAMLAGAAIGLLVYSSWATWTRMRQLYRRPVAEDLVIGAGESPRPVDGESGISAPRRQPAPGEERQGGREQ